MMLADSWGAPLDGLGYGCQAQDAPATLHGETGMEAEGRLRGEPTAGLQVLQACRPSPSRSRAEAAPKRAVSLAFKTGRRRAV